MSKAACVLALVLACARASEGICVDARNSGFMGMPCKVAKAKGLCNRTLVAKRNCNRTCGSCRSTGTSITRNATRRPTRKPTRHPTTRRPTKFPTLHFTRSPTAPRAQQADSTCTSSQSCTALQAAYGGWSAEGASALVCGESDNMQKPPRCTSPSNFNQAQAICIAIGARLCTLDELQRGETHGSGHCGTSTAWSASVSSCKKGYHMTVPTNKIVTSGVSHAARCTQDRTRAAVRCCADVVVGTPCKGSASSCSIDVDGNGQMDILEAVQTACCPGNKCKLDASTGVPSNCTRNCAAQFIPFYSECHGKLKFGKSDAAFQAFDNKCRAAWVSSGAQNSVAAGSCDIGTLKTECSKSTLAKCVAMA